MEYLRLLNNKILQGSALLSLSHGVGLLCSLGRNVIIARLITPADFGVAITFVMVMTMLEMMSNLSIDRLLVQAHDGDKPDFQNVAHLLQIIRGVFITTVLFIAAPYLAVLFSIPEACRSFYILAWLPLLNSFFNLDVKRFERKMLFIPGALVELSSQVLMLACSWPIGLYFGDYRAMLALLILKSISMLIGSHYASTRSFGLSCRIEYIRRFLSFGWPLLLNGLLMFAIMQGDRFIIASAQKLFGSDYSMTDVGYFSAALMLAMVPSTAFSRIAGMIILPLLAHKKNADIQHDRLIHNLLKIITLISGVFAGIMILCGDFALKILFGDKYSVAGELVVWSSVLFCIKNFRILPMNIAIAKSKTTFPLFSNIIRSLSLLGVLLVVYLEAPLKWVIISGICGEIAACILLVFLVTQTRGINLKLFAIRFFVLAIFLTISTFLKLSMLVGTGTQLAVFFLTLVPCFIIFNFKFSVNLGVAKKIEKFT